MTIKHDHKVGIISTINIYYLLFAHLLYMHESICFNKVRLWLHSTVEYQHSVTAAEERFHGDSRKLSWQVPAIMENTKPSALISWSSACINRAT